MWKSVKNWLQKCIFHVGEIFMKFFCLFWNCFLATSLSNIKNVMSQQPVDVTYTTCIFLWGVMVIRSTVFNFPKVAKGCPGLGSISVDIFHALYLGALGLFPSTLGSPGLFPSTLGSLGLFPSTLGSLGLLDLWVLWISECQLTWSNTS